MKLSENLKYQIDTFFEGKSKSDIIDAISKYVDTKTYEMSLSPNMLKTNKDEEKAYLMAKTLQENVGLEDVVYRDNNDSSQLSNCEEKIVLSTLQFLGSKNGEVFLKSIGYTKIPTTNNQEQRLDNKHVTPLSKEEDELFSIIKRKGNITYTLPQFKNTKEFLKSNIYSKNIILLEEFLASNENGSLYVAESLLRKQFIKKLENTINLTFIENN